MTFAPTVFCRQVLPLALMLTLLIPLCTLAEVKAEATDSMETVFTEVRVFDGTSSALTAPTKVLVRDNLIVGIGDDVQASDNARVIKAPGHTLMPGLIDVHVHLTFSALSTADLMSPDLTPESAEKAAAREAEAMLLRGFTAVRDVGGPVWGVKAGIDQGRYVGPRVWPSGATISQTGGHGDFRAPQERSRRFFGQPSRAERLGATFIADGRAEVLTAVRENLRFGASQIKMMAGGGTSSAYDPVDVTQYTLDEMRAGVEAAEDWGTYVTVHAYTPRAVKRAIEAGVRVIEHGQLLDEETLQLIADNDVWLSLQVLRASTPDMDPLRRTKRQPIIDNQPRVWSLARKLGIKLAWGTDFLFEPDTNAEQNAYILLLEDWFSPAEILKLVTHDNAQLLALSGLRSPYPGRLGVVEAGAFADLLLVRGNPIEDLSLIGDPENNFVLIMKDGQLIKDQTSGLSDPEGPAASPAPADTSRLALDWAGTYSGIVPCASCPGIETVVTLNNDGSYSRSLYYIDEGTTPLVDSGTFVWNDAGSSITLDAGADAPQRYQVGEHRLFHLDMQGRRIEGALAEHYILNQHLQDPSMEDTRWQLVELNGTPIDPQEHRAQPFFVLQSATSRVSGNTSCNAFGGAYVIKSNQRIDFGQNLAMTRMACPDMNTEQAFVQVLTAAERYELAADGSLALRDAGTTPMARFVRSDEAE